MGKGPVEAAKNTKDAVGKSKGDYYGKGNI